MLGAFRRLRRGPALRAVAITSGVAVATLVATAALGVGTDVVTLAEPSHAPVSAVPGTDQTADPDAGLGLTPTTSPPPPPTTTSADPGGEPSGGTETVLLGGGRPQRVSFGMHVGQLDAAAWPSIPVGAFRIWNGDSTWGALEPAPGEWRFNRLDARVEQATARGASVLLVLSHPPAWASSRPDLEGYGGSPAPPRDLDAWRTYVSTVVTRYAGRIEAYEIWNEPNLAQFFVGTPAQLGELTRVASAAIRSVDPAARIVSAGFSARTPGADAYFRSYVASGIAGAIDVVGIHIYPFPGNGPESMVALARRFRGIADGAGLGGKPMWNTEIGYGRTPDHVVPDDTAASLILRTYLVLTASGLDRNYWYMWDDRAFIGLYLVAADRRSPTPSAQRYVEAQRWLVGAEIERCTGSDELWSCSVRHVDGAAVTIVWTTSGEQPVTVPAGATRAYVFGGGSTGVSAGDSYVASPTPVLLAPGSVPSLE